MTDDELMTYWGMNNIPIIATIPAEERCWSCDSRRIAENSAAGLCVPCRDELRAGRTKPVEDGERPAIWTDLFPI